VFTARYGLLPYIKQITFRLQKVQRSESHLSYQDLFFCKVLYLILPTLKKIPLNFCIHKISAGDTQIVNWIHISHSDFHYFYSVYFRNNLTMTMECFFHNNLYVVNYANFVIVCWAGKFLVLYVQPGVLIKFPSSTKCRKTGENFLQNVRMRLKSCVGRTKMQHFTAKSFRFDELLYRTFVFLQQNVTYNDIK
jgi:hypothetical protein